MPRISAFYGILIAMYYSDHPPPHFHARYGEHEAQIVIDTGEPLQGWLPRRELALVQDWAALHRQELSAEWRRAERQEALNRIDPLPMTIPYHVLAVEYLSGYSLRLTFADGLIGGVDLAGQLAGPVGPMFAPIQDLGFFAQVEVDTELGTLVWPNGADFAPEVLHRQALDLSNR